MGDPMHDIRQIYQSWLAGDLSQEDTLFAIGDALDMDNDSPAKEADAAAEGRSAAAHKSS